MSTDLEPAFLADILENPADRAARLIYADWLEEQRGDDPAAQARARFIRAQWTQETADHGDPAWRVARVEAKQLLARYESAWTESVRGFVRGWTFRCGFVERVQAAPGVLSEFGSRLIACVPLRALSLRQTVGGWSRLMQCPLLGRIEELEVQSTFHGRPNWLAQLAASPNLGRLRRLFLDRNPLPVGSGTLLGTAPGLLCLEDLTLGRDIAPTAFLREVAPTALPGRIVKLNLSLGWIDPPGAIEALRTSAWPALTALTLQGLDCQEMVAGDLASIPWLGQLHHLTLDTFRLYPGSLERFLGGAALGERLESLTMNASFTTQQGMVERVPLERCPNLRVLALGRTWGETTLASLRREPALPRLHTLELDGANLRGKALDSLLATLERSPIRQLALTSAQLGDAEIERLAKCPGLSGVQELDLSGVPFSERGVNALLRAPNASGLLRLVLRHCVGMTGRHRRALLERFPIVETRV